MIKFVLSKFSVFVAKKIFIKHKEITIKRLIEKAKETPNMTDTTTQKYDLVIIGTGMAGMAAAVFAANRGISTVIVGSLGETWFTGGLIDLMGVHPIGSGDGVMRPK